jgi:hypothetical protein
MSWKPEVKGNSMGTWAGNALRFATRGEAEANVEALMMRRIFVHETRTVECDDAVNYAWAGGRLVEVTSANRNAEMKVTVANFR